MWKKSESESAETQSNQPKSELRSQPVGEKAIIGPSLVVKGDVSGDEDLTIQGQVEGKVVLKNNGITVGKNGRIKADLYGKTIAVEGSVQGNLYGEDKIVVRQSGNVRGNLLAPRVTIEDGAKFKGSIDMEGGGKDSPAGSSSSSPKSHKDPGSESSPKGESTNTKAAQPELDIKINRSPSSR